MKKVLLFILCLFGGAFAHGANRLNYRIEYGFSFQRGEQNIQIRVLSKNCFNKITQYVDDVEIAAFDNVYFCFNSFSFSQFDENGGGTVSFYKGLEEKKVVYFSMNEIEFDKKHKDKVNFTYPSKLEIYDDQHKISFYFEEKRSKIETEYVMMNKKKNSTFFVKNIDSPIFSLSTNTFEFREKNKKGDAMTIRFDHNGALLELEESELNNIPFKN